MRRRMLIAQQDDGNLADVRVDKQQSVKATKIDNGYLVETTSYTGIYSQYARFKLTTYDITESLWGKTVRVSADVTSSNRSADPLFRLGYVNTSWGWKDFKIITLTSGEGHLVIEYTLPTSRPSNMYTNYPLALLINTQRADVTPLNIITITNIRLEVID